MFGQIESTALLNSLQIALPSLINTKRILDQYSSLQRVTALTADVACFQAAIDMANVEIQYGSNADLIALAREIVASQTAQIETFNMVLADSAGVTETAG